MTNIVNKKNLRYLVWNTRLPLICVPPASPRPSLTFLSLTSYVPLKLPAVTKQCKLCLHIS